MNCMKILSAVLEEIEHFLCHTNKVFKILLKTDIYIKTS